MAITDWSARWLALRRACEYHNAAGRWAAGTGKPPHFEIAPKATETQVRAMEMSLGWPIPASFRKVLLHYSAKVCVEWAFPDGTITPEAFREVWAGECRWDLASLPQLQEGYRGWIAGCFADPTNEYDRVWHNKFPVLDVGNGDVIGIDISAEKEQPVVYLSHEDGPCHGYWLGKDFEDYIDRLSLLGCVGSEDWQLAPFLSDPRSFLQTSSEAANHWRAWFGLKFADTES